VTWWLASALLAISPALEVHDCTEQLDEGFARQLGLEWTDAPEGARVSIHCVGDAILVDLSATGLAPRSEKVVLPELTPIARGRLLALLVAERGRSLGRARVPLVTEARPVVPPAETPSGSALPEPSRWPPALWALPSSAPRRAAWRLWFGGLAVVPLWLGLWRSGPRLSLQRGLWVLGLSATFGRQRVPLGSVSPAAFIAEPEVVLFDVTVWRLSLSVGARATLGYGRLAAEADPGANALATTVETAILGGAGALHVSLQLVRFLSLEAEAGVGATWAAWARASGEPAATLGGGVVSVGATLVAEWGDG
jgi:hypothetical protein